ncbi:hypothetical protein, partial [Caballeronia choica]|uniref:hypothetical protein n=1 Tax=Caballeronia choica TaxID=326476 RepID=UPI001F4549C4
CGRRREYARSSHARQESGFQVGWALKSASKRIFAEMKNLDANGSPVPMKIVDNRKLAACG